MSVLSPCVQVCKMDALNALCTGCWRTIDEIIAWGTMDDKEKKDVLLLIEQRKPANQKTV